MDSFQQQEALHHLAIASRYSASPEDLQQARLETFTLAQN
jgi:hypothetical protein